MMSADQAVLQNLAVNLFEKVTVTFELRNSCTAICPAQYQLTIFTGLSDEAGMGARRIKR